MISGQLIAESIAAARFTHVVWLPDSHLGTWDDALATHPKLTLVRPCREGEAVCLAAGLMIGGVKPLVAIQCTGFFEAGDAVRNVVHDLKLPLKLLVGVRSWKNREKTADNCPAFTEPLVRAWNLPVTWFDPFVIDAAKHVGEVIQTWAASPGPEVLLWGE
jgi:sulfopyruvate decarboxylase TPP-binding subunit